MAFEGDTGENYPISKVTIQSYSNNVLRFADGFEIRRHVGHSDAARTVFKPRRVVLFHRDDRKMTTVRWHPRIDLRTNRLVCVCVCLYSFYLRVSRVKRKPLLPNPKKKKKKGKKNRISQVKYDRLTRTKKKKKKKLITKTTQSPSESHTKSASDKIFTDCIDTNCGLTLNAIIPSWQTALR